MLCLAFGPILRAWKIGWDGSPKGLYSPERIWWEVICWAKEHQFTHFDCVWLPDRSVEALRRGETITPSLDGIGFFKLGFGGTLVSSAGPHWLYSPVLKPVICSGGMWLARQEPLWKLLLRRRPTAGKESR